MKFQCEIIEDMLPLYKDGICSGASARMVEDHLKECPECSRKMEMLNNTAFEDMIMRERETVITSQSKYFKKRSAKIGSIIAAVFALPILICLIVDLLSGNGLGWFFIVLAAMLIPASLLVVPLMVNENKLLCTLGSFTASILVLLGAVSLYSKGSWFFIAAPSVLFGLCVCLSPLAVHASPLKQMLKKRKGLAVMSADTITFFIMLTCIGIFAGSEGYFATAFGVSVPLVALAWLVFAIIRYLPVGGLAKAGILISIFTAFSYFGTEVIANLATRDDEVMIYTTPSALYTVCGIALGVILLLAGLVTGKRGYAED